MAMKWLWGVGMFLGLTVSAAPAGAACRGPATVLEPATGAAVADFKTWLDTHDEAQAGATLYVADLDNDGKNEFAAASIQGSGGYLYLTVYARQPDGSFQERQGAPPAPRGVSTEGGWYHSMYRDPDSGESALFTRLCGKTYLSFSGSGEGARDSYLWEAARGTQPACDSAWTAFIRADFKKQYDGKAYERANNLLAGFLTQCAQALDDTTRAWVANDLAITQYHLGNARGCLEYAARAKKSPKVQRAARYNETLCAKAAENLPSDFSWLLEPGLTSTNQVVWARPFDMTLRALVPDLKTGNASRLREAVAAGLGGPPDDKQVSEQRYVTASACVAHACVSKAMMWVDVQERIGLVALNSAEGLTGTAACDLAIASRLVGPKAIPTAFWRAFAEWRSRNSLGSSGGCVSFIAADGTARAISPP